jgi:putative serine protease PepD
MAPDDDADDVPLGRPLPPEDRLWRHPSELEGVPGSPGQQIILVERSQPSLGRTLVVATVASLLGAGFTFGIVLGTGLFVRERPGATSHEVRDRGDGTPGADLLSVADQALDSVAHLEASGPNGSVNATAVVFRSDGELITTADAVDAAEQITVVLPDSRRITSPDVTVVAKSISADLAILKIPVDGLTPAAGSRSPARRWASTVVVDASPTTTGPLISEGVITREVAEGPAPAGGEPMYGLIETTTRTSAMPLSPGTLVLDDAGAVVGLVTDRAGPTRASAPTTRPSAVRTTRAAASGSAQIAGDGGGDGDSNVQHYAIPADWVWNVAAQLADTRRVVEPWVGLSAGDDLTPEEANREQITGGLRVTRIETGSPADSELQRDDIVVALESHNVASYNGFVTALRRYPAGSFVQLRVLRKGAYENILLRVAGKAER